jgi:hypothetical protein
VVAVDVGELPEEPEELLEILAAEAAPLSEEQGGGRMSHAACMHADSSGPI